MSAQQKAHMSPRAQDWYDDVMKQLETIEERMPANIVKIKRTIGCTSASTACPPPRCAKSWRPARSRRHMISVRGHRR